jgi:bifunctional non-homologous end joining protein LigD
MLASIGEASLANPEFVYEPKYDGIRAIVEVPAGGKGVRLWSRLGNDKTMQFGQVAKALEQWAKKRKAPLVLDGEVVALDEQGMPAGFQNLQRHGPTAFIAFDLLRDGDVDLRSKPQTQRRAALEKLFSSTGSPLLRISESVAGDGRELYARALSSGWEGLIAKRADSRYVSGKRSPDWRKLKIVHEQEFVIGGWTEPRLTRAYFGALLLGVFESGASKLTYVGHVGTGFNERELNRLMKLMKPIETTTLPFTAKPPSNERPHWVEPKIVVQVKFTEWTADGYLRHPVYLGVRDDKKATEVVREKTTRVHTASERVPASRPRGASRASRTSDLISSDTAAVVDQLTAIERGKGDGVVDFGNGVRLAVTNLRKVFWPKQKLTKGDLFRYYAAVSPFLLPAIADRPLVMKRFPNGIAGKPFYQHRAPEVPAHVRVEPVPVATDPRPHVIGGDLVSLLYTTQLASISQDPWFSRIQTPHDADFVALDLDPSEGVPFAQVLDVARWIHDELEAIGIPGFAKTSGADGLHVYLPLPPKTPYEAGLLVCQIIATVVSQKHPRHATIERMVGARGKRVYVDYLQNIEGKTLASAYSARASDYAGVSTPLSWKEVGTVVDPKDFTLTTALDRFRSVGDLWAGIRETKAIDLTRIERYTKTHLRS